MRECIGDCFGFHDAERGFAVGGEDVRDRTPLAFNDEGVGVDVLDAQALGEQTPNLRFTCTGQPDEDDGARSAHARSPTTAR